MIIGRKKNYSEIIKGFTKVIDELKELMGRNHRRIDAITDQVNDLETEKIFVVAETVKASKTISKLESIFNETEDTVKDSN